MGVLPQEDAWESLVGTPAEIHRSLAAFAKDADLLSTHYEQFLREHPSQWVGVYSGAVAFADTLPALLSDLESRGISPSSAVVRFVGQKSSTIML